MQKDTGEFKESVEEKNNEEITEPEFEELPEEQVTEIEAPEIEEENIDKSDIVKPIEESIEQPRQEEPIKESVEETIEDNEVEESEPELEDIKNKNATELIEEDEKNSLNNEQDEEDNDFDSFEIITKPLEIEEIVTANENNPDVEQSRLEDNNEENIINSDIYAQMQNYLLTSKDNKEDKEENINQNTEKLVILEKDNPIQEQIRKNKEEAEKSFDE